MTKGDIRKAAVVPTAPAVPAMLPTVPAAEAPPAVEASIVALVTVTPKKFGVSLDLRYYNGVWRSNECLFGAVIPHLNHYLTEGVGTVPSLRNFRGRSLTYAPPFQPLHSMAKLSFLSFCSLVKTARNTPGLLLAKRQDVDSEKPTDR